MSTMTWDGNRIMQQVGRNKEELGDIRFDENTKTWVLWLKDAFGVLGLNGGDIRGDEYESDEEAKDKAMVSPAAFIMHYIWIRRVTKRQIIEALDEHWDEISSKLDSDTDKETLLNRVAAWWDKLSTFKMDEWVKKIGNSLATCW